LTVLGYIPVSSALVHHLHTSSDNLTRVLSTLCTSYLSSSGGAH
jgi:hypothetical protein